jgi:ATP-dependent DNA helicase DinG
VLKQGVGRLLRSRRDHGVVAILDGRLRSKGYGRRLLDCLPAMPLTAELEDVDAFWRKVRDARDAW